MAAPGPWRPWSSVFVLREHRVGVSPSPSPESSSLTRSAGRLSSEPIQACREPASAGPGVGSVPSSPLTQPTESHRRLPRIEPYGPVPRSRRHGLRRTGPHRWTTVGLDEPERERAPALCLGSRKFDNGRSVAVRTCMSRGRDVALTRSTERWQPTHHPVPAGGVDGRSERSHGAPGCVAAKAVVSVSDANRFVGPRFGRSRQPESVPARSRSRLLLVSTTCGASIRASERTVVRRNLIAGSAVECRSGLYRHLPGRSCRRRTCLVGRR